MSDGAMPSRTSCAETFIPAVPPPIIAILEWVEKDLAITYFIIKDILDS